MTHERMEIRNFKASDSEMVVSLWEDVFPNSTGHNKPYDSISRKMLASDGLFFVAVNDESLLGTILAGYDGHRGWLYSLAVDTARRRNGIGTKLVRHAEDVLAGRGCPKVNLQVRSENAEVVAFYESLGFDVEQRISMGKRIVR